MHLKRLSKPILHELKKFIIANHWETKDYIQIATELDSFISSISPVEDTYNELLYLLAKLLFFSGQLNKLNELYTHSASFSYISGVHIFYALGLSFQGHSKQALEVIEQSYLEISENDIILYLESLGIELFIHSIKRDYKKVHEIFKEIEHILTKNKTISNEIKAHILPWAYLREAYTLRAEGNISSAMNLISECTNFLHEFPHRFFKVMAITLMGHCYHNMGNITTALELYDEAIDIGDEIQSKTLLSILYNRVGMAMSLIKKFEESKGFYQDAINLAIDTGSTWLTAGPLANLSQWKIAKGNIKGAIDDYHHFEEVTSNVGDERELCFAQLALANLYELLGDIPKSKYYFQEGVRRGLRLGILKLSSNHNLP
ncbi:MAG: tetratricopeptide repeat protein [Candidatus Hodarchaeota archaeon]